MFSSMHSSSQMTWHHTNKTSPGNMRHPSDGHAWKHFDEVHPDFAAEPRNVRLGLCSDGFAPYVQAFGSAYSCWPVIHMACCLVGVRMAEWVVRIAWNALRRLHWKKGGKARGLTVTADSYHQIIPLEKTRQISKRTNG
ncbi:unnamed protein product [Vicia faba]|uniref:Uncharacterized protein n=1 Tax=Vicia faba TaxID=3906 RepID=A0AAV1ADY1_VICFA|nr:unnamed protein product [Vicia faba]